MFLLMFCIALLITGSRSQESEPILPKILDTIKVGLRLASTFLNADQNDIVSVVFERFKAFHEAHPRDEAGGDSAEGLLPLFVRLLGLNTSKMNDYAFDGFILLAHLISLSLTNNDIPNSNRKQRTSSVTDFSPFRYIIQQPQVRSLLTQMEDPNMVEIILKESEDNLKNYPREDVECIPLLVCKMKPFVKGMQKSLKFFIKRETGDCYRNSTRNEDCQERKRWDNSNYEDKMFFFLPGLEEVIQNGDSCDERFPKCVY